MRNAEGAEERLKTKPGFSDRGGEFKTDKFFVENATSQNSAGRTVLYELSHEYEDESGDDVYTIFGAYGSYEKTEAVQARERQYEKTQSEIPKGS